MSRSAFVCSFLLWNWYWKSYDDMIWSIHCRCDQQCPMNVTIYSTEVRNIYFKFIIELQWNRTVEYLTGWNNIVNAFKIEQKNRPRFIRILQFFIGKWKKLQVIDDLIKKCFIRFCYGRNANFKMALSKHVDGARMLEFGIPLLWKHKMVIVLRETFGHQKCSFTWITFTAYWFEKQNTIY